MGIRELGGGMKGTVAGSLGLLRTSNRVERYYAGRVLWLGFGY